MDFNTVAFKRLWNGPNVQNKHIRKQRNTYRNCSEWIKDRANERNWYSTSRQCSEYETYAWKQFIKKNKGSKSITISTYNTTATVRTRFNKLVKTSHHNNNRSNIRTTVGASRQRILTTQMMYVLIWKFSLILPKRTSTKKQLTSLHAFLSVIPRRPITVKHIRINQNPIIHYFYNYQ